MANVIVANTSANVSGKTLVTAENSYTVAGLYTFSRSPSAPFAVQAASANVTNLDADLLDGQHAPAGTLVGTTDIQTLTNKTLTAPILGGTVTGTYTLGGTPSLSAILSVSASIQFTSVGSYPGAGSISKNATNGLLISAATGSSNDFTLKDPAGATSIIAVPTGTANLILGGSLAWGGGAAISSSSNVPLLNVGNTFTAGQAAPSFIATSSGVAFLADTNLSTGGGFIQMIATGGTFDIGMDNSTAAIFGVAAYAATLYTTSTGGLTFETVSATPVRFLTNGVLRGQIDSNGVMGITAGFRSTNGSTSVPNNTPTTIYTLPSGVPGMFIIPIYISGIAGNEGWINAVSDGTNAFAIGNAFGSVNLAAALSGLNVNVTQTNGSTQTVSWGVLRVPTT